MLVMTIMEVAVIKVKITVVVMVMIVLLFYTFLSPYSPPPPHPTPFFSSEPLSNISNEQTDCLIHTISFNAR